MNLRYLHYLQLVIAHGSFAAAARVAGVSQPAISHGMQRLQHSLGRPLFTVSGRKRLPTEAALRVAAHGLDIAQRVERLAATHPPPAQRSTQNTSQHNTLRVGATPSAALVCGPALHALWCTAHPRRSLDIRSADEGVLLAQLRAGELDMVIAPLPRGYRTTGLVVTPLYQLTPLVYARKEHPLARAHTLAQLQSADWAVVGPSVRGPVHVLQEAFAVRHMRPAQERVSCADYASMLHLMLYSDLLGVLPHPALLQGGAPGELVPLRLQEALPRYEMHLMFPRQAARRMRPLVAQLQNRRPID